MKVILTETVPKVGKKGHVVKVANGYARNYLFPRGLAIIADRKQIAVLEKRRENLSRLDASSLDDAQLLGEKLTGALVSIEGKAGHGTPKLFGAITSQNIVDAIKSQLGVSLERKQVALHDPIKRLGDHAVHLDLHREVDAAITVRVFDPSFVLEEPASEEPQAAEPEPAVEPESPATPPKKRSSKDAKAEAQVEAEASSAPEPEPEPVEA
jgi:large subunit ribosomal protein L9